MRTRMGFLFVTALILIGALVGTALAAGRTVAPKSPETLQYDPAGTLTGDVADLRKALAEPSTVGYKLLVIDETGGEDPEAYLDRVLEQWGWPVANQLLIVVYTKANHDIRFAMGSDFRAQGVTVAELVGQIHTVYVPAVRKGDPAHGLAEFIRAINRRMTPAGA